MIFRSAYSLISMGFKDRGKAGRKLSPLVHPSHLLNLYITFTVLLISTQSKSIRTSAPMGPGVLPADSSLTIFFVKIAGSLFWKKKIFSKMETFS